MTLNQARAILVYVIECKKKKMNNDEIVWGLANLFNLEEQDEKPKT